MALSGPGKPTFVAALGRLVAGVDRAACTRTRRPAHPSGRRSGLKDPLVGLARLYNLGMLRRTPRADLLLLVATQVEFDAAKGILGNPVVHRFAAVSVLLGKIGNYAVALVRCEAGASGRQGSQATLNVALPRLKPRAVIAVGIAFGSSRDKQSFKDVLISTRIIPYEPQRVGAERVDYRGPQPESGLVLRDRLNQLRETDSIAGVRVHLGPLLAGEKLLDNRAKTSQLFEQFRDAIGGEMEGAGIYAAADREGIEWIIIKGIVDFADGTKSDDYQASAAANACRVVDALCRAGGLEQEHFQRHAVRRWPVAVGALVGALLGLVSGALLFHSPPSEALDVNCRLGHRPSCRRLMDEELADCTKKVGRACLRAALLRVNPTLPIVAKDPEASDLLSSACELDNADGCYAAGVLRRRGVIPGAKRAEEFFEAGCRLGSGFACSELAQSGQHRDDGTALLEKACRLGVADACADLVANMSADAATLDARILALEGPCAERSPTGCVNLALLLSQQPALESQTRAKDLFESYCEQGYGRACTKFGDQHLHSEAGLIRDVAKARHYYALGCERGDFAGCVERAYLSPEGTRFSEQDACRLGSDSLAFLQKACRLGDPHACNSAGWLLSGESALQADDPAANELLRKACVDGSPGGCWNLGVAYALGRGVAIDYRQAAALLEKGCAGGIAPSCYDLGISIVLSDSSDAGVDRGKRAFDRACALGFDAGCVAAARAIDGSLVVGPAASQ